MTTAIESCDPVRTHLIEELISGQARGETACLVLIYPTGPLMGTRYLLDADRSLVGRTDDCKVLNRDASVSRTHASIDRAAGGYTVTDLASTNGTFVNDRPAATTRLADGDYLRIGHCIYRFLAGGNVEREYHEEIYRLTVLDGLTGLPRPRTRSRSRSSPTRPS